jgi:phytoene dehydrogenase-like protein
MLRPEVIRDLRLTRHGLRMVPCEPGLQAAFEDGTIAPWWTDHDRAVAEFAKLSATDAAAVNPPPPPGAAPGGGPRFAAVSRFPACLGRPRTPRRRSRGAGGREPKAFGGLLRRSASRSVSGRTMTGAGPA